MSATQSMFVFAGLLICGLIYVAGSGCSFLTPGFDTKQALGTNDRLTWSETAGVEVTNQGTQDQTVILAKGSLALGPDGKIDPAKSTLSHYFYRQSKPENAAAAYAQLAQANVQALSQVIDLFKAVLPYVPYMKSNPSNPMNPLPSLAPETQPGN